MNVNRQRRSEKENKNKNQRKNNNIKIKLPFSVVVIDAHQRILFSHFIEYENILNLEKLSSFLLGRRKF